MIKQSPPLLDCLKSSSPPECVPILALEVQQLPPPAQLMTQKSFPLPDSRGRGHYVYIIYIYIYYIYNIIYIYIYILYIFQIYITYINYTLYIYVLYILHYIVLYYIIYIYKNKNVLIEYCYKSVYSVAPSCIFIQLYWHGPQQGMFW